MANFFFAKLIFHSGQQHFRAQHFTVSHLQKLDEIGHFVFFQPWMITPMWIFFNDISLKFIFHLFLVSFIPIFVDYFVLYKLNCSSNNSI